MNAEPRDQKTPLADSPNTTQDDLTSPSSGAWSPKHAGQPTQQQKTPGRYQYFAETLAEAMNRNGLTASEVARRVWGEGTDRRGHKVAKNRDRIGHYLSGNSYPEPDNLQKLAEAVGLTVEELQMPPELPRSVALSGRVSARSSMSGGLHLTPATGGKVRIRGTIDRVIDRTQLVTIIELLMSDEPEAVDVEVTAPLGSVIRGTL